MTEFRPIPDPAGALEPPRRFPPTAVGAATPARGPERRPVHARAARPRNSPLGSVLQLAIALPLVGIALGVRAVRQLVGRR